MNDLRWLKAIRRSTTSLLILVFALGTSVGEAAREPQKPGHKIKEQNLEQRYHEWLDRDVAYIITREERDTFLHLTFDDARDKFIDRFWEIRNPVPGSPVNTYKDEIYRRIAYANQYFGPGSGSEGWRSDRGRIYITLGPPEQRGNYYNAANHFPMEIWFYSGKHPALPPFFYIVFYQRENIGDFRLYSPHFDGPDKLVTGTHAINDRVTAFRLVQNSLGSEVARTTLSLLPGEPVDKSGGTTSLESDVMISMIRDLANNPFTKEGLDRRREMLASVSARLLVAGSNLDLITLPVRDSRGLTRCDFALRFRNPSDLTVSERGDGKYYYSVEARVRVFNSNNKLIFTQQNTATDTMDKRRLAEIKDKAFGYEGSLPLPPGKYRLDFLLTDWIKKTGYQVEKEVEIPAIPNDGLVVAGVLPFADVEVVDPAKADLTPFTLAGVRFTPLSESSLVLSPYQSLQFAYQIWTAPKDPRTYVGQKLVVNYALGRPAAPGSATVTKDQVSKEQFDATGSLVNGKKLSLSEQPNGNYLLTVTVEQSNNSKQAFNTFRFSVLSSAPTPAFWDIVDPSILDDARKGILDAERGLCYLALGQNDEARGWFRRALKLNHGNETARARLVDAYFTLKDYVAVVSLFNDAGITEDTDAGTILRIAESLTKGGDPKRAVTLLEEALVSHPKNGPLYLVLSEYYQQLGDSKKAAELARKARTLVEP